MRKPRKLKEGASYHVTARANRQEMILSSPELKDMFLHILSRAKKKYDFNCKNFCLMNNHIHLIIEPLKNTNLSRIMQWVLSVFAIHYNRKYHFTGHVWYDRFRSKIIQNIRQYYATFLYIANNPVKAKIVRSPFDYTYSGIYHLRIGIYDILERPPNDFLLFIWKKLREGDGER